MIVAGFDTSATQESQFLRIAVRGSHGSIRSVRFFEWLAAETVRLGASRVLLDMRGVSGEVSTADRFDIGVAAARIPAQVAVVARPGMIDAERFGQTVAGNRGADGQIFGSEAEAVAWLTGG
jgi:hypothetical protein